MLQTEFVEIANVRMSKCNFVLLPLASKPYQNFRIGSLVIIGLQPTRELLTALFTYK